MRFKYTLNMWLIALVMVLSGSLLAACGNKGASNGSAVPTFCPTRLAQNLAAPLALENSPPMAYYQTVRTTMDQPTNIVLWACDPDAISNPAVISSLSWETTAPPLFAPANGVLSAYSGTYPDGGIIAYVPNPGFLGTDSFPYHVWDGNAWSNTATVSIVVEQPQATATSLYFGGWDDSDNYHLWAYNSGLGLSTVAGTASELTPVAQDAMVDKAVFGGKVYFQVGVGDGGAILYSYDISSGLQSYTSSFSYMTNMEVAGSNLYVGLDDKDGYYGYLWSIDSAGVASTLAGAGGLYPYYLAEYGGILFFDSYYSGDQMLWTRDGSGVLTTHSGPTDPSSFTFYNNDLYFTGGVALGNRTLWRFNGSGPVGTVDVGGLTLQWGDSRMAVIDSVLCMNAYINTAVSQLWTYHPGRGVAALTSNVSFGVGPNNMTPYSGYLFFNGNDDSGQSHLWYTDGVTAGTVPGTAGLAPRYMAEYDGKLYFAGGTSDSQLWYVDSSLSAPTKVSSIGTANSWGGLNPSGLVEY